MQLGELEKQVLQFFWREQSADAKRVHAHFSKRRGGSLNTIQSTLDRLYKKHLLAREKIGHAYQYSAALGKADFIAQLIKETTDPFAGDNQESLLAAFVSISAALDAESLARLEKLISDYRNKVDHS